MAARLCAIDPGLGGMVLRGGGALRDAVIAALRDGMPGEPLRRVPSHIDDERLLGGIDLTATLALGRAVAQSGLLAEADGGIVVLPMAERLSDAMAGRLAGAIDTGPSRFVVVALDDGIEPDERPPAALIERLAFQVDLADAGRPRDDNGPSPDISAADPSPTTEADAAEALVATAAALGIDSARASLFALKVARALAQWAGRDGMVAEDVALAARLVLGPRAMRMPAPADESPPDAPPPPDSDAGEQERGEPGALDDIVLAAALAALPKDILARIAAGRGRKTTRASGAGERRASGARGRPMGARAGMPGGGRRLSLIDTLRAAAPWQRLRDGTGVKIRRDDLRIRRFETRAQALTIFAVDASGSSALARLAEAKGAVELLLAEAYVKRAEVALVAFRGVSAELLLPPTRSLVRARRSLAELPGGGGTPLAAGMNAARELAEHARARGRTPFIVLLTDGRANIAADGTAVRALAEADAEAAARAIGAAGIAAAFVDISARPRSEGAALAAAMRARYLPLPRADAATMHAAVRAAQAG
ncbi:magnesium chelatase [Sphingomonas sp. Leaf339]|nr:magnesium chelatase [Sphingomonas sp. Leaf339]